MARNPTPKRPMTPSLAAIYDAGAKARRDGKSCTVCPYTGKNHGDDIYGSLWIDGYKDANRDILLTDIEDLT